MPDNRAILYSTWFLLGCWLFCIQELSCLVSFRCMLGGSVEVWTKTFYLSSLSIKLMLACQEVLKWDCPPCTNKGCLCSNLHTTSKHAPQVKRNYWSCMQNNQWKIIWTNSQWGKDNSNTGDNDHTGERITSTTYLRCIWSHVPNPQGAIHGVGE